MGGIRTRTTSTRRYCTSTSRYGTGNWYRYVQYLNSHQNFHAKYIAIVLDGKNTYCKKPTIIIFHFIFYILSPHNYLLVLVGTFRCHCTRISENGISMIKVRKGR